MTLIELIIVMIVISLLGAVVVVNIGFKGEYAVNTQADQMRRDISHLQLLATSWGVPLRLSTGNDAVTGADYYSVICMAAQTGTPCAGATAGTTVPIDPATGAAFTVLLTDGVSITKPTTLDFDSMGRPISHSSLVVASTTYQLSLGSTAVSVYVRPITGYAETG